MMGRDSSVGIATRYGLDCPGIESGGGARFSAPVQTGREAHPASCTMGTRFFPGGKAAGAWRWPPTPSSAEVKERVELYLYSTFWPSWPVLGWTLPLPAVNKTIFCLVQSQGMCFWTFLYFGTRRLFNHVTLNRGNLPAVLRTAAVYCVQLARIWRCTNYYLRSTFRCYTWLTFQQVLHLFGVVFSTLGNRLCESFKRFWAFFVLLTVHLSIILDNDQLDTHLLYFTVCLL